MPPRRRRSRVRHDDQTLNVPANDRFQVIAEHVQENLIIDRAYLGVERSPECLVIQVALDEGRTTELKKAFYKAVADGLHRRLGLRKQDVPMTWSR